MRKFIFIFCLLAVSATTAYSQGLRSGGVSLYAITDSGERVPIKATSSGSLESTYDVSNDTATWRSLVVNDGSSRLYMENDSVHQWSMSNPGDVTSLSYVSNLTASDVMDGGGISSMDMKPDGSILYVGGYNGTETVIRQFDLSSNYDISSYSFVSEMVTDGRFSTHWSRGTGNYYYGASGTTVYTYEIQ